MTKVHKIILGLAVLGLISVTAAFALNGIGGNGSNGVPKGPRSCCPPLGSKPILKDVCPTGVNACICCTKADVTVCTESTSCETVCEEACDDAENCCSTAAPSVCETVCETVCEEDK